MAPDVVLTRLSQPEATWARFEQPVGALTLVTKPAVLTRFMEICVESTPLSEPDKAWVL